MHGCTGYFRQDNRHGPYSAYSPFNCRVYRTVAITLFAGALAIAFVQGCRGQREPASRGFSSPSSEAGRRYVLATAPFFQRNYLSASAGHAGISTWPSFKPGLESAPSEGKAGQIRAVSSESNPVNTESADDMLLIQALIAAAVDGEGCKAAGGVDSSPPFYFTTMIVTAYCPLKCCCGRHADSFTASGHRIQPGERFAAAPRQYPFGTVFDVPGYGPAACIDRGGAIKGNKLDLYFDTHTEARGWGVKTLIVKVTAARDAAEMATEGHLVSGL